MKKIKLEMFLLCCIILGAELIIAQNLDEINKKLEGSILFGKVDEVEQLIKDGADVNKRFDFGASKNITPLYLAVVFGYRDDIAKVLINSGADPKAEFETFNLLHVAALYGGNESITKLLITKGLDVNKKCEKKGVSYGITPLIVAAGKGNIEVAKVLLDNGAEINARLNSTGYTPLHYAAREGHSEMISLLIEMGADINVGANNEDTPLDVAIYHGRKEVAELLKKNGGIEGNK